MMRSPVCPHPVSHQTQLVAFIFKMHHGLSHPAKHPLFDTKQWAVPSWAWEEGSQPPPSGVTILQAPSSCCYHWQTHARACSWC